MAPTAEQIEATVKTFFSRSACLTLHPNVGKRVIVDGQLERMGEIVIEFQPTAPDPILGQCGAFTTEDPEVIAYLEKRSAKPGSDVMTWEQYSEACISDADKVKALRTDNSAQSRLIEEQNRIIADLRRAQAKVPVPVKQ